MLAFSCLCISLLPWLGFMEWINRLDSPPPPHVSVNWQSAVIKTRQLHTSALLNHDYLRQQCFAIFRQYDCSTEGLCKRNSSVMQLCGSVSCKCKWKSCGTKLICKRVVKASYTLDARLNIYIWAKGAIYRPNDKLQSLCRRCPEHRSDSNCAKLLKHQGNWGIYECPLYSSHALHPWN